MGVTDASAAENLARCLERIDRGVAMRKALLMNVGGDSVPYAQPLIDAVTLFDALGIGYAMVDGVAAMYYGRARFTEDIDFVAVAGHMQILERSGDAMRQNHFDPSSTWKLYHERGLEVDIWKDEHSDAIVSRAREVELAGRKIRIADPHDLIAMKLRAGRLQDDYDISEILRSQTIDDAVIGSRVDAAQFSHYQDIKRRTGQP
jgi:hypothetical protein